jgi:glycogen synthase
VTPEVEPWVTAGGLGVMVAELATGLAELGAQVLCIAPYYEYTKPPNAKDRQAFGYLAKDGIQYSGRNITVQVGAEAIVMGVHEGVRGGVHHLFLHNALVFPFPYPPHDAYAQMRVMTAFNKGVLEALCKFAIVPSLVVTNDWFTGLTPAFTRNRRFFGDYFNATDFLHICHNLNEKYEGRLYPKAEQGSLYGLHGLDHQVLVDPHWGRQEGREIIVNPSRAALLTADTWATVSCTYREELLRGSRLEPGGSPLKPLLRLPPHPFACSNGISLHQRTRVMRGIHASCAALNHAEAKAALQKKYFGCESPHAVLLAFVGRVTEQKGVHLILECVERVLQENAFNVQFFLGGMASTSDPYGARCAGSMYDLLRRYPRNFWADPNLFFKDGPWVNLAADYCLMPSQFEPGGIVQHEFFLGGTPVVAYSTGGLKDSVVDWDPRTQRGNGFTFCEYHRDDLQSAIRRAAEVYFHAPEDYGRMRANATASVLSLDIVTRQWCREFHRLRRCLMPPERSAREGLQRTVAQTFRLALGEAPHLTTGSRVCLAGTFNGWEPSAVQLAWVERECAFVGVVQVAPGLHQYKFVVDGVWCCSKSGASLKDADGNVNNICCPAPGPLNLECLE